MAKKKSKSKRKDWTGLRGWTGLTGAKDKAMKKTGKKFYVVNTGPALIPLETEEGLEAKLSDVEWEDWCCVIAETKVQALKMYEKAFDQWQRYNESLSSRPKKRKKADEGTPVKVHELLMFRRDTDDYEVGSEQWQAVMAHNCAVNILSNQPLSKSELTFIQLQNQHLNYLKEKRGKK